MQRGCSLGNTIYPNSTGLFNVPYNPDVERFATTDPITIRFYNNDPQCGIRNTTITSTGQRCIVGNTYGAGIVEYETNDINCDLDGMLYLLLPILFFAVKYLRKSNKNVKLAE